MGCTCTRQLGKKIAPKKFTTEIINKRDENNYKKEGEEL